jgi:hypothetical protein
MIQSGQLEPGGMGEMLTQESEQALIEDYRAYRLGRLLTLVCEQLRRWKAGRIRPDEIDRMMDEIYLESCVTHNISRQRRDRVVNLIQWWDREWFLDWVRTHTPPSGGGPGRGTDDVV